jgi:hypothetical protein
MLIINALIFNKLKISKIKTICKSLDVNFDINYQLDIITIIYLLIAKNKKIKYKCLNLKIVILLINKIICCISF